MHTVKLRFHMDNIFCLIIIRSDSRSRFHSLNQKTETQKHKWKKKKKYTIVFLVLPHSFLSKPSLSILLFLNLKMSAFCPTFNNSTQAPISSPTPTMPSIPSNPSYKDIVKIILLVVFLAILFVVLVSLLCLWVTLHIKSWPRQVGIPPPEVAPEFINIALTDEDDGEDDIAEEEVEL